MIHVTDCNRFRDREPGRWTPSSIRYLCIVENHRRQWANFFSREFTEITLKAFDRELWTRGEGGGATEGGTSPEGEIKARARGLFANRRREARIVLTAPRDNRANWQLDRVRIRRYTAAHCSPGLGLAFRRRERHSIYFWLSRWSTGDRRGTKERSKKVISIRVSLPLIPFTVCTR